MEILIAIILIAMTVIFLIMKKGSKVEDDQKENIKTKAKRAETPQEKPKITKNKQETSITSDNKDCLINSFREVKDMRNLKFIDDGKSFIFSDEKRIIIGQINNLVEKSVKFISKSIEADTISDLVYSKSKKYLIVIFKFNFANFRIFFKYLDFYYIIKSNKIFLSHLLNF